MATKFRFNYNNQTVDFEDYYVKADSFSQGNLWLWGRNAYGQIGDNTITNRSSPTQTIAGGSDWKKIASGDTQIAAIKSDKTLWLWGRNAYGQIGDNTIVSRSSPVQEITFGTNWSSVSCGSQHTVAIKTDGTLWNWGPNTNGNLGDGTNTHRSSPVQTIAGGNNWSKIACGATHTAAIKTDGTLWLWGRNNFGQIGNNTASDRNSPVQTITGGSNWSSVACGYGMTAAIKTDGTLWIWGYNYFGQMGDNTTIPKSSPVQTITGGNNWSSVSCGRDHTASIKTDGTLWAWGRNVFGGGLGNNTTTDRSSPVQTIKGGSNWKQVSGGFWLTAALTYFDGIVPPPLATVSPTPTMSPSPVPTSTPTPTPSRTTTPVPTNTIVPTPTPTGGAATPVPSGTPGPTSTPVPSGTPSATSAPGPTEQFEL